MITENDGSIESVQTQIIGTLSELLRISGNASNSLSELHDYSKHDAYVRTEAQKAFDEISTITRKAFDRLYQDDLLAPKQNKEHYA